MLECLEARIAPALVISEIAFNPGGNATTNADDAGAEYLEIRGDPGATIADGTYLLQIEGDGKGTIGVGDVDLIFDLSGLRLGRHGFLVFTQGGVPYDVDPNATLIAGSVTAFSAERVQSDSTLEFADGSATFLLIQSDTPPSLTDDIDSNNDGVADGSVFGAWTIVDSIGHLDGGGSLDCSYSQITFATTSNQQPPAGTVIPTTFTVGYLGRQLLSTGNTANDWIASQAFAFDGSLQSPFILSASTTSVEFASEQINHVGAINFPPKVDFSANGRVAKFVDPEGDQINIRINKGALTSDQVFAIPRGIGRELLSFNLLGNTAFAGANVTITANPTDAGGDSQLLIKSFSAETLGKVTVDGDVGLITLGVDPNTTSVKSITLRSLTGIGTSIVQSTIAGNAGKISILGDLRDSLEIGGNSTQILVAGSILAGADNTPAKLKGNNVDFLTIGGNVIGNSAGTGSVRFSKAGNVLIKGSIIGGSGNFSGHLDFDEVTKLKVLGSVIGGISDGPNPQINSGRIFVRLDGGDIFIAGSIVGNDSVFESGGSGGSNQVSVRVKGKITVGGDLVGGTGASSGTLVAGDLNSIAINGSVVGGEGLGSGTVVASAIKSLSIGGNVFGGPSESEDACISLESASTVTVRGSLIATSGTDRTLYHAKQTGRLLVAGDVIGSGGDLPTINASGGGTSFGELVVGGTMRDARIEAFSKEDISSRINVVRILRDFINSNIAVDIRPGEDSELGTDDDSVSRYQTEAPLPLGKVIIQGRADMTSGAEPSVITARSIGSITVGGMKAFLDPLKSDSLILGGGQGIRILDYSAREINS